MQEKNIITQTKKEFQSMLSTFSHEIRNPLALITSEMQMLSDSQPQLCFNEHWDNIMENLNYIRELLDELSRYQNAGHITLVQTNLSICLDRITSSFRPALDYLGISFETDIPRDLPQIMEVVDNASDENNENTRRKATVVPIKCVRGQAFQ